MSLSCVRSVTVVSPELRANMMIIDIRAQSGKISQCLQDSELIIPASYRDRSRHMSRPVTLRVTRHVTVTSLPKRSPDIELREKTRDDLITTAVGVT